MGIRVGVLVIVVSSLMVSSATATPLLTMGGETFLSGTIGSPSSFTFVVDNNQTNTNNFWLALEGIDGPTLVLAEAMVGNTTYLLGAFSPWQFDRNVVVGQGSPGRYFVSDPCRTRCRDHESHDQHHHSADRLVGVACRFGPRAFRWEPVT
jgi:hypothetical protein